MAAAAGSVAVALLTAHVMRSLGFLTTTPALRFTRRFILLHVKWFFQGLLRMGNGLSVAPHSAARTPLVVAAGLVTLAAFTAALWLGARSILTSSSRAAGTAERTGGAPGIARARNLYCAFWAASILWW